MAVYDRHRLTAAGYFKEKTMKSKKSWAGIMVIAVIFGIMLISCQMDSDPTYTVWTDTVSYSEYSSAFGALNDGWYRKIEIFSGEIDYSAISNEYKHNWTENEIYNWFLGRGFISSEANELKAWVVTINHCIIASRSGSIVHMLIK
jgi:hypothetical protein